MDQITKTRLEKQHYHIIGNHSAVKVCGWTKKSIKGEGACYKQKFYGIESHRCAQITPSIMCDLQCVFCWRDMESHTGVKMTDKIDTPEEIISGALEGQWRLLQGFNGNPKADKEKLMIAKIPNQWAISLTGEPTIYPYLSDLIDMLHKRGDTTFLVTNGMFPKRLRKLSPPTQLYMSLDAPNEELFIKVDKPTQKNAWKNLTESLGILNEMRKKGVRTVLRLTLVKGINDTDLEGYARLIKIANPMFVEVKSYMFIGSSRLRLAMENMMYHEEVQDFSKRLTKLLGWKVISESSPSRVCLIAEKNHKDRFLTKTEWKDEPKLEENIVDAVLITPKIVD